ncbi:WXG100 family type VII secretion target [Streptomyces sp. NPDC005576]|uniref:WXG100 family type VII secretion target n=1 Tax=unclassified Streptomyces TaxID=2593676 RepID=UPI0033C54747
MADDGIVFVDYAGTSDVADTLIAYSKAINGVLEQLENNVKNWLPSSEGDAVAAFTNKVNEWQRHVVEAVDSVTHDAKLLAEITSGWNTTDSKLSDQWQSTSPIG